jgi:hypothetical protein
MKHSRATAAFSLPCERHNDFDLYCGDILAAQRKVRAAIIAALMPGLSPGQLSQIKREQRAAKAEFRAIAAIMRAEIRLRVDAMDNGRRYSEWPGRRGRAIAAARAARGSFSLSETF